MLLDNGADANAPCSLHGGSLESAVECDSTELIELLFDKGADVQVPLRDSWHGSILYQPVLRGRAKIVELMLKEGADANAGCEYQKISILNHAVVRGTAEVAEILLRHGANPNAGQDRVESMNPRLAVQYRDTGLNLAVMLGDSKKVSLLLCYGAKVDTRDADGWSALEIATSMKNRGIIELLRKFGAKEGGKPRLTFQDVRTKLADIWVPSSHIARDFPGAKTYPSVHDYYQRKPEKDYDTT